MAEIPVSAWRCEECRNWHPAKDEVHEVLVLDVGQEVATATVVERIFFPRRLRVCSDCRRDITGETLGFERR
jgi:hypothetical protein